MHEYSIVQSLLESVNAVAREHEGARVHHVFVSIGELAGVDCDLLQTAYDAFRPSTICENARLTIRRVDALWQCPQCGAAIRRGEVLTCGSCSKPACLTAGSEILLERVELEVA